MTESGSTTIYVVAHDKEGNYGATTVSVVIQAQTLTVNATAIPASIPPTFSPTTYPIIAAKPDGTEIDVTEIESSKTVISSSDPTIIKVERAADADNRLQVIVTRLAERGSANLYFFIVDKNGDAGTATITVRIQEDSILAYANQLPTSIGTDFSIANYPVSATSPGGDTIDITTCTVTVSSNDPNTIAVSVVTAVAKTDPDYNKIKIERKAQVGGVYVTLKIVDSIGRVGTATTIISIQNSSLIIDPSNIPATLSPVDPTDDYYYTISVARPEGIAVDLTDSRTQVDVNSSAPTIIDAD